MPHTVLDFDGTLAHNAEACAAGPWAGRTPAAISLQEWLDRWLTELDGERRAVAVFPDPDGNAINHEPSDLRAEPLGEARQYS
jgi:hypothetical protein